MTLSRRGILAEIFDEAVAASGLSRGALTVLANKSDPYLLGSDKDHNEGKWFADQLALLVPNNFTVHLRGLHYRIVASPTKILKPDGTPYRNDDPDWEWLQKDAAKAARWLGYVPFARIIDQRNAPPFVFVPDEPGEPWAQIFMPEVPGFALDFGGIDLSPPRYSVGGFSGWQPYRIALFGEKVSLQDVLYPLAQRYGTELILPTGESTDTLVHQMAARADRDGRPLIVLYFTDFDPSGWQMAISVSRKLQALIHLEFPSLEVRVYRLGLSIEQVKQYTLPSTPLKDTEKRADKWLEEWGQEQTEIDALAALRPELLQEIAEDAILQFYDTTLDRRVRQAERKYQEIADQKLRAHPNYQKVMLAFTNAQKEVERIQDEVEQLIARSKDELDQVSTEIDELGNEFDDLEPPEMEVPEPEVDEDAQPTPWFDSDDDFVSASQRLKNIKALDSHTLGRRVRINLDDPPRSRRPRKPPEPTAPAPDPVRPPRVPIIDDDEPGDMFGHFRVPLDDDDTEEEG